MRNRTIRSVLARRPMFANGGMLPPVTQNPMAAGILASSSPLVETVNNQQSPNQGVRVSMKDGGIAKFQNGGFTSFPSQTVAPDTSQRIASYLSGYGLDRQPFKLVSEEAINIMDPDLRKRRERIFPGFRAAGGEGDPPGGRLQRSFYNLAKGAQAATSAGYGAAESGLRYLLSPTAEEKGYSVGQQTTIDELIRRRPDLKDTIMSSADDAIKVAKSAWDEYQLLSPEDKKSKKGTNLLRQYGITPTDPTISGDNLANQIALGVSMKFENLENLLDVRDESEDASEVEIQALFREGPPGASGPSSVPGVSDVEGFEPTDFEGGVAEGMQEADIVEGVSEPTTDKKQTTTDKKQTTTANVRKQLEKVTKELNLEGGVAEGMQEADIAEEADADRKMAKTFAKTFDKPDMSEKEATKTIEDYKKIFSEAMPKYEGMSEEEKGFALMEAGLRVAAGESSNAITNIAKGLKGIGDTFAKDKKEKRAWDRQVDLSAAKYALTSIKEDKVKAEALAKEGRKRPYELVAQEDFEFQGRKIKKGQAFPATEEQLRQGILFELPLTYAKTFASEIKDKLKLITALNKNRTSAESFTASKEKYVENLDSYKSSLSMKAILRDSAKLAAEGKVLGPGGFFGNALDKALNAIGVQKGEEVAFLKNWRTTDKAKYDTQQKRLGVAMATELLREGSKTLSDFDRKRVEELIGDLVGTDGLFIAEEVLEKKLANLERTIDANIIAKAADLEATETQWGREISKGGTPFGGILPRLRTRTLGTTSVGVRGSGRSFNIGDIYDFNKKKFKAGYLQGAK